MRRDEKRTALWVELERLFPLPVFLTNDDSCTIIRAFDEGSFVNTSPIFLAGFSFFR